jgi:hypothetical protein
MKPDKKVIDLVLNTYVACTNSVDLSLPDEQKVKSLLKDIRHYCKDTGLSFYDLMIEASAAYVEESKQIEEVKVDGP